MVETQKPETQTQVLDALRWAVSDGVTLKVVGAGSKERLGRAVAADCQLDLGALSGIATYQPEELFVTAGAATPLYEIEAALAERKQALAFEPVDLSRLLGAETTAAGNVGGTLGGAIACNLAGPARIRNGSARDHLLGFHAVSGRGEEFKSGGTVVKNVTGFDLSKLISGSYGTLAVMTEVTVRALPMAEETRTILVVGCEEECGVRAMTAALQSPCDVSGAAHLPADVAALSKVAGVQDADEAVTAIRLEGPGPSVEHRARVLRQTLAGYGTTEQLDRAASLALWREIRDVTYFADEERRQVWRISVPPSEGARIVAELLFDLRGQAFYDWGGGLVWLALEPCADAAASLVRAAVASTGGHTTLIRADDRARKQVSVFQPQPLPLATLTKRVKEGFDPNRVLNPGRMYEGI